MLRTATTRESNGDKGAPARGLLYEQGFKIGGARQQLVGEDAQEDRNQSGIVIKQVITELEDLLRELKS